MKAASFSSRVVLAIGAHPDDIDYYAAGTIARLVAEGATAYYLVLTDGSKGSADPTMRPADLITIRRTEQRLAAKHLGVKEVFFLDYEDGGLECNAAVKRDIVRLIRQVKPDTVIVFDPTLVYSAKQGFINHPDHRACGQAVMDAVYPLARDHMAFPELATAGFAPHKTKTLLLTNFAAQDQLYIDISAFMDVKLKALAAHDSQGHASSQTQGQVLADAEAAGDKAGCKHAEGFVRIELAQ